MNAYLTVVIHKPENGTPEAAQVAGALSILKPYTTAMSMEDEMTLLDCIQGHAHFPDYITDEARDQVRALHEKALTLANLSADQN